MHLESFNARSSCLDKIIIVVVKLLCGLLRVMTSMTMIRQPNQLFEHLQTCPNIFMYKSYNTDFVLLQGTLHFLYFLWCQGLLLNS